MKTLNVIKQFVSVICAAVSDAECYAVQQEGETEQDQLKIKLPSIVYDIIGERVVDTLGTGPRVYAIEVRVDSRAKTFQKALDMDAKIVTALRVANKLDLLLDSVVDYDEALSIYVWKREMLVK